MHDRRGVFCYKYSFVPIIASMIIGVLITCIVFYLILYEKNWYNGIINKGTIPMSYHANIIKETLNNQYFRKVLFTGDNSQLVVMSIPPGGEVGEETHKYTEQTLFFLSGTGEGILDDKKFAITPGDVVVVVPGTKHNFVNTGVEALKIYTTYSPPNHIDGRIHKTKKDADADKADEAVGEIKPVK